MLLSGRPGLPVPVVPSCRRPSQREAAAPFGGSRILPIPAVSAGVSAAARRLERRCRALPEGLARLEAAADCSWLRELQAEGAEEAEEAEDNRQKRLVSSGHYVEVRPTPLHDTCLVGFSADMAQQLGLGQADCGSSEFLRFMSGHMEVLPKMQSWCTPYTLSVAGNEISTGNMYGDGRAISVGEVLSDSERWELQLKGAGCTPFCRSA
ncbi:unnamed protein product [Effrenium voratum]|nr:unnamed protein product [Effrenium voratum]